MAMTTLKANVREDDVIILNVQVEGKTVQFEIFRGDCGISIDAIGTKGTITEMGWVSDDDLDLIEEDEE